MVAERTQRALTVRLRRATLAVISTGLVIATAATPVVAAPRNPSDGEIASSDAAVDRHSASVAQLADTIADTASAIAAIEQEMGGLREAVNKALVDLHDAQTNAELARQNARSARGELDETQKEIEAAQTVLDQISRALYRSSATSSAISRAAGSSTSDDALDRKTYLRLKTERQEEAIAQLDATRTKKANKESLLRKARNEAESQEREAHAKEEQAREAIDESAHRLSEANDKRAQLIREQASAQAQLDEARATSGELHKKRKEYQAFEKAEAERKAREAEARRVAEERRKAEEKAKAEAAAAAAAKAAAEIAEASQRAARIAEAQRKAEEAKKAQEHAASLAGDQKKADKANADAQDAAQAAAEAAVAATQPDHATVSNPYPTSEKEDTVAVPAVSGNNPVEQAGTTLKQVSEQATAVVSGSRAQKIEAVIARAESQLGVTYAWGGGTATGPSLGIRDGGVADSYGDYNKIGFDCSGLVLYAFAGVGISLPHYSGYQYQRGTKIPPAQMQRGDLIFYGPNAEYHVAIYLGNGMMIEAPQSGSVVQKSPVRWGGMSPYVVRLI